MAELIFEQDIILENERVLIRPLREGDSTLLLPAALSHPDLLQYSPQPIHSEAHLASYVTKAEGERKARTRYPFAIYDKQADAWAGSSSYMAISPADRRLEIGHTWLGTPYQKTGLNRHVKFLLLRYAFEELEYERVEFKADERNTASRTALEKLGATYEGTLRSHMVVANGFRRNTVYYSILRSEWPGIKERLLTYRPS